MNQCPLGSGAMGGTTYPIDRSMTARALGFDKPTENSIDGVSDRDYVLELGCGPVHSDDASEPLFRGNHPVGQL